MGNTKYERAQARARLALIAPTVDDVTAAYFDKQVEKVLLEARQREQKSDRELVSTLLDAVARNSSRSACATAMPSEVRMTLRRFRPRANHET
jgi:hypothetical protein